jgi:hypothetical protein
MYDSKYSDDSLKKEKREIGIAFIESISKKLTPISNSDGMYVMSDVMLLEAERIQSIIIRKNTESFWKSVIVTVGKQDVDGRNLNRVCVVGNAGIGKTSVTPYLIRMLLEVENTVVYCIRQKEENGYYYEFISKKNDSNCIQTTVNFYKESERVKIQSLYRTDTYFIVDPSKTKDSCDQASNFRPKLIIVTSPSDNHWGQSNFTKPRGDLGGTFKYMPVWELQELLSAAPILSCRDPELLDLISDTDKFNQEIIDRYRNFGGIPRYIFAEQRSRIPRLWDQDRAIALLPKDLIKILLAKNSEWVDNFSENRPKGILMHYVASSPFSTSFDEAITEVSSYLVFEKICSKFMPILWSEMLDDNSGKFLEAYLRNLLCQPEKLINFENRPCVSKTAREYKSRHKQISLGGCHNIRGVIDPISSALENPMMIFYSYNESIPLFDFCYFQKQENCLVFIQATTSISHDSSENSWKDLEKRVNMLNTNERISKKEKFNVLFCYAAPAEYYQTFTTNPVNPKAEYNLPFQIRHINVKKIPEEISMDDMKK